MLSASSRVAIPLGIPTPHAPRTTKKKNRFRSKLPEGRSYHLWKYISEDEGHEPSPARSTEAPQSDCINFPPILALGSEKLLVRSFCCTSHDTETLFDLLKK